LDHNYISGSIPHLPEHLDEINLAYNRFTGSIPEGVFPEYIKKLNLAHNNLTGSIPPELGKLTSLVGLDLSNNHLSGTLPYSLDSSSNLDFLDLSYNMISGELNIRSYMKYLDLSFNRFSEVDYLNNLENIGYCNLEGNPNFKCLLPYWASYICYTTCTGK